MIKRVLELLFGSLVTSSSLLAQTWHTAGIAGNVLELPGNCGSTWYDPDVFVYPDNTRGFLAQGDLASTCAQSGNVPDAIYRAKFDPTTLSWQIPASGSCPTVVGHYVGTDCPGQLFGGNQPIGSPAVARVGNRYFMAFSGGNVDFRKGHLFWATSTNAVNWIIYNWDPKPAGFAWKPLIYPRAGDLCELMGIPQITLTYDPATDYGPEGTFYVHFNYHHRVGALDTYSFRIPFASAHPFGLGSGMQVALNSGARGTTVTWVPHSGAMVFDYDGEQPAPGDPVLVRYGGNVQNFDFGGGSIVRKDASSSWLRAFQDVYGVLQWQSAMSLASGVWSAPKPLDMASFHAQVKALYPSYQNEVSYGGLWFGKIGTRNGLWMFVPTDIRNCAHAFSGLGIFTVALNFS